MGIGGGEVVEGNATGESAGVVAGVVAGGLAGEGIAGDGMVTMGGRGRGRGEVMMERMGVRVTRGVVGGVTMTRGSVCGEGGEGGRGGEGSASTILTSSFTSAVALCVTFSALRGLVEATGTRSETTRILYRGTADAPATAAAYDKGRREEENKGEGSRGGYSDSVGDGVAFM